MNKLLKYFYVALLLFIGPTLVVAAVSVPWNRVQVGTITPLYTADGVVVNASSTIGNGTAIGGLTVSGGSTTTLNAYFASNIGIGTTSPFSKLSIVGGNIMHTAGNPVKVASLTTGDFALSSAVQGKYLYVGESTTTSGFQVVDISNPGAPVIVGNLNTYGFVRGVAVSGKYAYINTNYANNQVYFNVVDISDPAHMYVVSTTTVALTGQGGGALILSGGYAFISGRGGGGNFIDIINVGNPRSPVLVKSLQTGTQALDIKVQGKYMYFIGVGALNGLVIYDISDPANPSQVSYFQMSGSPTSLDVSGRYAYITNQLSLATVDVSNIQAPVGVATSTLSDVVNGVSAQGMYLYVNRLNTTRALLVYDISNGANPVLVGTSDALTANPLGQNPLTIAGNYAYVNENTASTGIEIIKLSGLTTPTINTGSIITGTINTSGNIFVNGEGYFSGGLNVGISGIASRGPIFAQSASSTASLPIAAAFIGNTGVGTSSPAWPLTVQYLAANQSATTPALVIDTPTGSTQALMNFNVNGLTRATLRANSAGNFFITPQTAGNILLDTTGNVGIGTTSPWSQFSITNTGTKPALLVANSTNTATQFTVASNGNIGIGTTTPISPLDIVTNGGSIQTLLNLRSNIGQATEEPAMEFSDSRANNSISQFARISATGGSSFTNSNLTLWTADSSKVLQRRLTIDNAGNVGIGTTSPATLLEVGGSTANVTFDAYKNCTGFTSDANGLLACTPSDERLKTDINTLGSTGLDALHPVSFYFKDPQRSTQEQFGLIAQEVQKVYPNLVTRGQPTPETPDGTLMVDYNGVIPLLVARVQELTAKIDGSAIVINTKRSAEENWQWAFMGLIALYIAYNENDKRKRK